MEMLPEPSFRQVVLLYPIATALHVLEEWPAFPRWARRFASPRYSDREYVVTHVCTLVVATVSTALVRYVPEPWIVFPFFAIVLGPAVFCNALFHAGASLHSRVYCPGTLTGVVVYLPLSCLMGVLAVREGLASGLSLVAALFLAALIHVSEVGHNVFKRW